MRKLRWLAVGVACGVLFTVCMSLGIAYFSAPQWYRILFIGSDQRGSERARSDVMVILNIPRDHDKQPILLSVPRDTAVHDDEYGLQKMTHFYAFGDRLNDDKILGNVTLTQQHIEELLGISIDATIEVTFQSFVEIVNSLGGACIEDACATAGDEALAVIRDRFSEGRTDFSRQENEREVLAGLIGQLRSRANIVSVLKVFKESDAARLRIHTTDFLHFFFGYVVEHRGRFTLTEYQSLSVPGSSDKVFTESFGKKLYYWVPDTAALSTLIQTTLK